MNPGALPWAICPMIQWVECGVRIGEGMSEQLNRSEFEMMLGKTLGMTCANAFLSDVERNAKEKDHVIPSEILDLIHACVPSVVKQLLNKYSDIYDIKHIYTEYEKELAVRGHDSTLKINHTHIDDDIESYIFEFIKGDFGSVTPNITRSIASIVNVGEDRILFLNMSVTLYLAAHVMALKELFGALDKDIEDMTDSNTNDINFSSVISAINQDTNTNNKLDDQRKKSRRDSVKGMISQKKCELVGYSHRRQKTARLILWVVGIMGTIPLLFINWKILFVYYLILILIWFVYSSNETRRVMNETMLTRDQLDIAYRGSIAHDMHPITRNPIKYKQYIDKLTDKEYNMLLVDYDGAIGLVKDPHMSIVDYDVDKYGLWKDLSDDTNINAYDMETTESVLSTIAMSFSRGMELENRYIFSKWAQLDTDCWTPKHENAFVIVFKHIVRQVGVENVSWVKDMGLYVVIDKIEEELNQLNPLPKVIDGSVIKMMRSNNMI